jgi:hypothetical protein
MDSAAQARPTIQGTVVILGACVIGYFLSFSQLPPSDMARLVSIAWLAGIGLSFLLDWRLGLRNLIRVDVFALMSLYFLLFFEFLFPQSRFDLLVVDEDVVTAVQISQAGLAALVIGRHIKVSTHVLDFIGRIEMRRGDLLLIYFAAFFFSHLPMWVAVDFNLLQWWDELVNKPRFGRSWGRGRYGDISALLHELQLLGYIMPPIAGVIFARWREYGKATLVLVGLTLLLLWFGAFSSGTRNILAIQVAGFLGGYLIVQERLKIWKVAPLVAVVGVSYVVLADMMLEFRNIGMSQYFAEGRYQSDYKEFEETYWGQGHPGEADSGYFVDYNLWRMSQMVAAFPGMYAFLGWNLPYVAVTKPIPRVLWPGKPMDLKVGLEEAIGAEGYTIACTWIGEAWVSGGLIWIIGIGLLIGVFCRFWNQLATYLQSPFALIVFASGFYAVLLLMRSLMFFTTALLPSLALIVMGVFLYKHRGAA